MVLATIAGVRLTIKATSLIDKRQTKGFSPLEPLLIVVLCRFRIAMQRGGLFPLVRVPCAVCREGVIL